MPKFNRIRTVEVVSPRLEALKSRYEALELLLGTIHPVPTKWLRIDSRASSGDYMKGGDLTPVECTSYKTLIESWENALTWSGGLDTALSCVLASIVSTRSIGDQLWLKIMGPAACAKSTLAMAVSTARKYILPKSSITGFHSGFKGSKGEEEEDNSLVAQLFGKSLVTKDGDTLMQSESLGRILSEARDLYDSTCQTHYRNKMSKEYSGLRMTWILFGTSSLKKLDASELGERFLDCVIMTEIDDEMEIAVLRKVGKQAFSNLGTEVDADPNSHYTLEQGKAMRLTGGYVEYLRENAPRLFKCVATPQESDDTIMNLARFTAYMRARPPTNPKEEDRAEREFAARLMSQLSRLAGCLAVVMGQKSVNNLVMDRVRKVALDTSRGYTLDMSHILMEDATKGSTLKSISLRTNTSDEFTRRMLNFLKKINVVEVISNKGVAKHRLTDKVELLYREVMSSRSNE